MIAEGMKSNFRHIWPWQTVPNTPCVKFYTKWLKVVHIMVAFVTVCSFVVFVILIKVKVFPLCFALAIGRYIAKNAQKNWFKRTCAKIKNI